MAEIIRSYGSAESAQAAVKKLHAAGFTDAAITMYAVGVRPPYGFGEAAAKILDASGAIDSGAPSDRNLDPTLAAISELSKTPSPGYISALSAPIPPGSISSLSGRRSPGSISSLSQTRRSAAISSLSGRRSAGSVARLSGPTRSGSISSLSSGWSFSGLFGLPLLTRYQ
jgi:hypothetical protein